MYSSDQASEQILFHFCMNDVTKFESDEFVPAKWQQNPQIEAVLFFLYFCCQISKQIQMNNWPLGSH